MEIQRKAERSEIEEHLFNLGGGNHRDNLIVLYGFPNHFLVRLLDEDEFLGLVFLQNDEVLDICPLDGNRRLGAVARRAIDSPLRRLSSNWDLDLIKAQTKERLNITNARIEPLFLRDARGSEKEYGRWYLQDGSHRGLGYAMALTASLVAYVPVEAYCATAQHQI